VTESYQNEPDTLRSSLPCYVPKLCKIEENYRALVLAETHAKGFK